MEVVAPAYPLLSYQPSEYVPEKMAAPEHQWREHGKIGLRAGLDELANIDEHGCKIFPNCLPAVSLDLRCWPDEAASETCERRSLSLMLVANTLHITPWTCTANLFRGAGQALADGGYLIIYGPFKVDGRFIGADGGAGNARFDAKLQETNGEWGLRDVSDLQTLAAEVGLVLTARADMPANNLTLCFVRVESLCRY